LYAINEFASVNNKLNKNCEAWKRFQHSLDIGCDTFLDSGIFNLTNNHMRKHGTTMDEALALAPEEIDNFDWLFDLYLEVCTEYGEQVWGYSELDQGGKENKIKTRAKLESLGLSPMPVYHPLNDGWDYFDDLAKNYDRICFGNLVQASSTVRIRLLLTAFERHHEYPDLFIHFLGLTPSELQMSMPFDSADSSTWTAIFRYPQATRFSAAGKKRWALPFNWFTPYKADDEQLRKVSNLTLTDLACSAESIKHYHETLNKSLGINRYEAPNV
jgi:hypothetical protein